MKIMIVNNSVMFKKNGGLFIHKTTGNFLNDLIKNAKHNILFFQFIMPYRSFDSIATYDISKMGLDIIPITRGQFKIIDYIRALFIGFQATKKADFVYLFYPANLLFVFLAIFCRINRTKYGFYIRGEQGMYNFISRFIYKKAEFILTVSPNFTQLIKKIGVPTSTIRPMIEFSEADIITNRKYDNKSFYEFLFIGRIERIKGIYELIDSIQSIVNKGFMNFKLHIIGDGDDLENLNQIILQYKLNDLVICHGAVTEKKIISDFYSKADLFIFPSYREGFPRVLYEAMIFGVPILTTFTGAVSNLMIDGFNCYKLQVGNTTSIINYIEHFLNDYQTHARIAKNATNTIIEYLKDKKLNHANHFLKSVEEVFASK